MNNKREAGFSLVELLLVVAIIGILAAIAVPNLLTSRRAANEGSALTTLRVISSAEATYQSTAGGGSFGNLTNLNAVRLIDSVVAAATIAPAGTPKHGYRFSAANIPGLGFAAFDAASQPAIHTSVSPIQGTGSRSFFVNETGIIYLNATGTAPTCTANAARTVTGTVLN